MVSAYVHQSLVGHHQTLLTERICVTRALDGVSPRWPWPASGLFTDQHPLIMAALVVLARKSSHDSVVTTVASNLLLLLSSIYYCRRPITIVSTCALSSSCSSRFDAVLTPRYRRHDVHERSYTSYTYEYWIALRSENTQTKSSESGSSWFRNRT